MIVSQTLVHVSVRTASARSHGTAAGARCKVHRLTGGTPSEAHNSKAHRVLNSSPKKVVFLAQRHGTGPVAMGLLHAT
eukprot:173461-Prorocentrum_minimum.AAC.1